MVFTPNYDSVEEGQPIHVAAFYRFVSLPDFEELKSKIKDFCVSQGMTGTILLASEGINSTLCGSPEAVQAFFAYLNEDERLKDIPYKLHSCDESPFDRMKVRLKKEIVRMGVEDLDTTRRGEYLSGEEWDKLISDPDVVTVDTRNNYEVQLGTFEGAVNPYTEDFRSFPQWVDENLDPEKNKKVAMFCTGGIRCEKSTALLKAKGFEEVYHLDGGILQYLQDTGNKSGKWNGTCFVFDERVALDDKLQPQTEYHCTDCATELTMDEIRWLTSGGDRLICRKCFAKNGYVHPKLGTLDVDEADSGEA